MDKIRQKGKRHRQNDDSILVELYVGSFHLSLLLDIVASHRNIIHEYENKPKGKKEIRLNPIQKINCENVIGRNVFPYFQINYKRLTGKRQVLSSYDLEFFRGWSNDMYGIDFVVQENGHELNSSVAIQKKGSMIDTAMYFVETVDRDQPLRHSKKQRKNNRLHKIQVGGGKR